MSHPHDRAGAQSSALGIAKMMGVCNTAYGLTYRRMRVQSTADVLFANAFGRRRGTAWDVCEELFCDIFGNLGSPILKTVRGYSEAPFQISRVLGTPLERNGAICP